MTVKFELTLNRKYATNYDIGTAVRRAGKDIINGDLDDGTDEGALYEDGQLVAEWKVTG